MRELAESMMRLSWAMSMLGVKGAVDMLSAEKGWRASAASLEAMKEAAERELGDEVGGFYRAGERLQGNLIDGVGQVSRGAEALAPERFLRSASELLRHSADLMSKVVSGRPPGDPGSGGGAT